MLFNAMGDVVDFVGDDLGDFEWGLCGTILGCTAMPKRVEKGVSRDIQLCKQGYPSIITVFPCNSGTPVVTEGYSH